MNQPLISNHGFLCARIVYLRSRAKSQEMELKESLKDLMVSSNPVTLAKNFVVGVLAEKTIQHDLKNVGFTAAADFLIGNLFGKYSSVKRYIVSSILEKVSAVLINRR
ncbi:MAG: hypothetical protein Q8K64_04695 [Sediminibacterium sp.]|nr:hypothetical protein [Sediminibacterium sp.]